MNPLVSVIMPIYNVEKYLVQSLLSVLRQTLKDIEIICVNDGSTDRSLEILNYFAQKDQRIKIINIENSGYGHAMNVGIEHSSGKYIGIVEPDDYIKENMYEYLYDTAEIFKAEIVKSDFYRFYISEGRMNKVYQPVSNDAEMYATLINPEQYKECFRNIMNIWCGIYKKKLIDDNKIKFNETPGASFQDNGFWFKTLCYAHSLIYTNIPFYMNRRDNPESSVKKADNIYCCNKEYSFLRKFLYENKMLEQKFLPQLMIKKYETYKFNINRINGEQLKKYLMDLSHEWQEDYRKGDIKEENFKQCEWQEISRIINEPEIVYDDIMNAKTQSNCNDELKLYRYQLDEIRKSKTYKVALTLSKILNKFRRKR